jgi:hypothetical protein
MEHWRHIHCTAINQTGKTVETALHSLVYKTERTLEDGLIALGALVYFETCFMMNKLSAKAYGLLAPPISLFVTFIYGVI